jgi:hypothetical protein
VKPLLRWHHSRFGSVVLFLGGIRLAVPVLLLVAAAMGWGTWIESTRDAGEAGRTVYGAWWFMALMGLVCMSLILSVVTRFPWRRKHVGFITVHASLVMLIISAFVSRFTRIEGRIVLAEGESAAALQLDRTQIEVLRHNAGQFIPEDSVALDDARPFTVAGASVTVTARWANSTEEFNVTDDGANPLHAIELRPGNGEALWIGQSNPGEPPQDLDGVFVRVLPEGERWTPPPAAAGLLELRTDAGTRTTLSQPGVSLPGDWVVQRIQHFERAVVEGGTLIERDTGPANPAALVELAHANGSIERHIAFARFPDGIHKKTLAGETHSPFVLRYGGAAAPSPLVCFERIDGRSAVIVWTEARTERFERPGAGDEAAGTEPDHWRIDSDLVGSFVVLREYTRARGGTRLVEAPEAENSRPALVIAYMQGDHQHTAILPWTQRVPLQFGDEVRMLRYGPRRSRASLFHRTRRLPQDGLPRQRHGHGVRVRRPLRRRRGRRALARHHLDEPPAQARGLEGVSVRVRGRQRLGVSGDARPRPHAHIRRLHRALHRHRHHVLQPLAQPRTPRRARPLRPAHAA